MQAVRHLLAQRHVTMLICAATLLMKLLVPAGYMIGNDYGRMTITICSGVTPAAMTVDMPEMHGDMADPGKSKDHGKAEMPCVFTGLTMAALNAVQLELLIVALAFTTTSGLRPRSTSVETPRYALLPWPRGPPFPF